MSTIHKQGIVAMIRQAKSTLGNSPLYPPPSPPFPRLYYESLICPAGTLSKELEAAIQSLKAGLVERDTEVRLMLLAALAGEHILFIGPPGTAKSELGRRLSSLCKGGTFFERLLTRFTVPEVGFFLPLEGTPGQGMRFVNWTKFWMDRRS